MLLPRIESQILAGSPVIAFVNTLDLEYWNLDTDHAIVVIGFDAENIYANDPFYAQETHGISRVSFQLAQLRFGHLCAVIAPQNED